MTYLQRIRKQKELARQALLKDLKSMKKLQAKGLTIWYYKCKSGTLYEYIKQFSPKLPYILQSDVRYDHRRKIVVRQKAMLHIASSGNWKLYCPAELAGGDKIFYGTWCKDDYIYYNNRADNAILCKSPKEAMAVSRYFTKADKITYYREMFSLEALRDVRDNIKKPLYLAVDNDEVGEKMKAKALKLGIGILQPTKLKDFADMYLAGKPKRHITINKPLFSYTESNR